MEWESKRHAAKQAKLQTMKAKDDNQAPAETTAAAKPIPDKTESTSKDTRGEHFDVAEDATSISSLHIKMDMLIKQFKQFRVKPFQASSSKPFTSIGADDAECISKVLQQWPSAKNIQDAIELSVHMRLFPGMIQNGQLSVIRCETCFAFLNSKFSSTGRSPSEVAKKGLGG